MTSNLASTNVQSYIHNTEPLTSWPMKTIIHFPCHIPIPTFAIRDISKLTQICQNPCMASALVGIVIFTLARWLSGKECACQCRNHRRHGFEPWVGKISWRTKWQSTPVFLLRHPMDREVCWAKSMGLLRVRHHWACDFYAKCSRINIELFTFYFVRVQMLG